MLEMITKLAESPKTIERICVYRQLLQQQQAQNKTHIFSHDLADLAKVSPSQVRRDLMLLKCVGSPSKGYEVSGLLEHISSLLSQSQVQKAAIVGVGNLGRAIMSFFYGRDPNLKIIAGFDSEDHLSGRVIHGCRCHNVKDLEKVIKEEQITVAIVTVPDSVSQEVIDKLVSAGIKGILNFTHVRANVPDSVFISDVSFSAQLEVVAFYAKLKSAHT